MRADEPFTDVDTNKIFMPKYINQLRYERLMAKGFRFHEMQVKSHEPFTCLIKDTKSDYDVYVQCERIAEALEARAKRIKEGGYMISEDIKDCDEYTKGFCDGCDTMKKHFDKLCDTLRTTKRALWLARAERANIQWCSLAKIHPLSMYDVIVQWQWVERKCREKAEEYK